MQVDRPQVRAADTNRVVLWVSKELKDLSGTYAAKYIRLGRQANLRLQEVQGRARARAIYLRGPAALVRSFGCGKA